MSTVFQRISQLLVGLSSGYYFFFSCFNEKSVVGNVVRHLQKSILSVNISTLIHRICCQLISLAETLRTVLIKLTKFHSICGWKQS